MPRTGRDALLDVLRTEGVRHLFGNPGSTELPLMDALAGADDLHYVLCLQEATAVGMAMAEAHRIPELRLVAAFGRCAQAHLTGPGSASVLPA